MSAYDRKALHRLAPAYLQRLGLREVPFAPSPDPRFFYIDPGRVEQLKNIEQWAQDHDLVLLVTGPVGSGKTSFLQHLAHQVPANWELGRLVADPLFDTTVLWPQLSAAFAAQEAPPAGSAPHEAVYVQLAAIQARGARAVLAIDDAHLLPPETLEALAHLADAEAAEGKLLRLILFADPVLEERLTRPAYKVFRRRITHNLGLPALDAEQSAAYLAHRLRVAGYQGELPFSESGLKRLQRRAGGLPGRLNALADASLNASGWRRFIPRDRRSGLVVATLGMLVLGAVLLLGKEEQPITVVLDPPLASAQPLPSAARPVHSGATPEPPAPQTTRAGARAQVPGRSAPDTPPKTLVHVPHPPMEPREPRQDQAPALISEAKHGAVAPARPPLPAESVKPVLHSADWLRTREPDRYTLQLLATGDLERLRAFVVQHRLPGELAYYVTGEDQTPVYHLLAGDHRNRTLAEVAVQLLPDSLESLEPWVRRFGDLPVQRAAAHQASGEPHPVSSADITPPTAGKATAAALAAAKPAETASLPAAASPLDAPIPEAPESYSAWLWAQHPRHFTVQILGSANEQGVRHFMATHALAGRAAYFRTVRDGRDWFVLVYGVYPDRSTARAAIAKLGPALRAQGPWPRSFASLHADAQNPSQPLPDHP